MRQLDQLHSSKSLNQNFLAYYKVIVFLINFRPRHMLDFRFAFSLSAICIE